MNLKLNFKLNINSGIKLLRSLFYIHKLGNMKSGMLDLLGHLAHNQKKSK